ncbi:hypothetical protein JTB14_028694 [Gonioctena quinquepunctata]|nr:hypothetical protein JTB14_028694 [Gonioctena quinquepunctata]
MVVVMQPNGLTGISIEEDTIRTGLKIRGKKLEMKSLPQLDGPTDPSSDLETTDEGNSPITKGKTKKVKRLRRKDVNEDMSSPEDEEEGKTPPKNRGNNSKEKERNPLKQASRGKKLSQQPPPIILEGRPIINKKEMLELSNICSKDQYKIVLFQNRRNHQQNFSLEGDCEPFLTVNFIHEDRSMMKKEIRSFELDDNELFRNYNGDKWLPGKVHQKDGTLTYTIVRWSENEQTHR